MALRRLSPSRSSLSPALLGSGALKGSQTGIAILLSVALARFLGPSGYGTYAFAYAVITLAALPAALGLPQLVVRESAQAVARSDWGGLRGLWRWTLSRVAFMGALVAGTLAAGAVLIGGDGRAATLIVGAALVPLLALANVTGGALRGLRHTVVGQLPPHVLRPALLLAAVALAFPTGTLPAHPVTAMALHVAAGAAALGFGGWLLWRRRPEELTHNPTPRTSPRTWRAAAWPLALLSGMTLITQQADIIMLGVLGSQAETGIYRATVQAALLVLFGLQAINAVLAPHLARLHAQGQGAELQRLVTRSTRWMLAAGCLPAVAYGVAGEAILGRVFGEEFTAGYTPLVILATGQLLNTALGPVGLVLNMTGHERATLRAVALAAAANIGLNALLIPPFGMAGAAVATATALVLWNGLLWWAVRRHLGIGTTAFGAGGKA